MDLEGGGGMNRASEKFKSFSQIYDNKIEV